MLKGEDLNRKLRCSKTYLIQKPGEQTSVTPSHHIRGSGGGAPRLQRSWGSGVSASSRWAILCHFWQKKNKTILMAFESHFARF